MKEINIFYSKIGDHPTINKNSDFLKNIPKDLLSKSEKYVNWKDRELNIIGKLLLIEGLKLYNIDSKCLEALEYTKYGKPFLNIDIDFNISHSGEYAICALTKEIRLGVDIEEIKTIDLNSFSGVFTKNEFIDITSSKEVEKTFYNYWTIKESVVKAIGKGLSIPLKEVKINTNQKAFYDDQIWHVQNLEIDTSYSSHIAIDHEQVKLNYHLIDFYN